jgi:hypothetical protein
LLSFSTNAITTLRPLKTTVERQTSPLQMDMPVIGSALSASLTHIYKMVVKRELARRKTRVKTLPKAILYLVMDFIIGI